MTLKNNQIDIHESVNKQDRTWIKKQIAEVYSESNKDLLDLKKSITNTTNADEIMEKKFTMDHVKKVLKDTVDLVSSGTSHKDVFEKQWAGLTLSLQIALTKLGFKPWVIDGIYMKGSDQTEWRAATTKPEKEKIYSRSNTRKAVKAFQEQWNKNNPNNKLVEDWRAGKETLTKILEKLNQQPIITWIDSNPKVKLADKPKESEKLLAEIGAQYLLPKGNRTAEKIDKTLTTPSKIILKSNIGGKTVEIEFGETDEDLSGFNPNFKLDFWLKTRYYNPTLISWKDSFDLQERILWKWPTAKTIITLIPKKEETKPVKKTEKSDKPVVIPTPKKPEKEEETEILGLKGDELNDEAYNYDDLKWKLQWMNWETITALGELQSLQEITKTKLFCFESENQKTIEEMLAPVIIATGDMPPESVQSIIGSDASGCVSYGIGDIAETLNIVLQWINDKPELKDIDLTYFKKFCKYLLTTNPQMIKFENWKYIDNPGDWHNFINVLFIKALVTSWDNTPELSIKENWQNTVKSMNANEAMHELRHAEFETVIAKNPAYLKEFRDFFYGEWLSNTQEQTKRVNIVKLFLNEIYIKHPEIPYQWHFSQSWSNLDEKTSFINSIDYNTLKDLNQKINSNDNYLIKRNIPFQWWNIGTAEFNLLTEFWAYAREQNPTIDLDGYKFTWEQEWHVAPQASVENNESEEILNTIESTYDIAGNNNSNIQELKVERTTIGNSNAIKLTGKIENKDVSILFDGAGKNPRLVRWDETLNLYEIPQSGGKNKIVVVPDSSVIVENFLSYRDNLVISWWEPITWWKFDFSDSEKISIVFKDGDNEIKISFDNVANLMTQEVSISNDKYKVSINDNKINLEKVIEETVNNNVSNNINSILEEHKAPLNVEYENNKYNYEKRTLEILKEKFIENKNKFWNNQKFSDFEKLINDKINEIKTTLNNYKTNPSTIAIWTPEKNRMDASLRVDWMIRDFLNRSWLQSGQSSMTDIIDELE